MPWKEGHRLMERVIFLKRLLDGERMVDLCREFGISRKTGYKYLERYKKHGEVGLLDQSTKPGFLAKTTPKDIQDLIVELRKEYPTWGAAKIRERLKVKYPGLKLPARSTVHEILDRHGLVKKRKKMRYKAVPTDLKHVTNPNELWCADFKGHFRLQNGSYCYPLTITDYATRYLICCEAQADTQTDHTIETFKTAFREHGIPSAIRTDNGNPFSTRCILGLSRLSVFWLKLGIRIERIEPGKPQQNGRHERMHLTLKQETTRPPSNNFLQQQERFDIFMDNFNNVRPHEALNMQTPSSKYKSSEKVYSDMLPDLDYPEHDYMSYVNQRGRVHVPGCGHFNLTSILEGEIVGLRQEEDEQWRVTFANLDLGFYDAKEGIFTAASGQLGQ